VNLIVPLAIRLGPDIHGRSAAAEEQQDFLQWLEGEDKSPKRAQSPSGRRTPSPKATRPVPPIFDSPVATKPPPLQGGGQEGADHPLGKPEAVR
jgi:hypothetical protein